MKNQPNQLHKKLQHRHITMIALGGSIGTGIFLTSGYAIHLAGPGGAVFAYLIIALMVFAIIASLGELSVYKPSTGTFCNYAIDYVDRDFGKTITLSYWLNWVITLAAEIVAAGIILQFWFPDINLFYACLILFIFILLINLFSVKVYGELEYWMSSVKVITIVVFIILGIILIFKSSDFGRAVFFIDNSSMHNGFIGFFQVFILAGFAFQGAEIIGINSGEAADPKRSIPQAVSSVFWRLILFYILTTLIIGLLIPYNSTQLFNNNDIHSSPFTLVFSTYFGKSFAPHLLNGIIFVAILSAANASLYSANRLLWYMASNQQMPKIFNKVNAYGLPFNALILSFITSFIIFLLYQIDNKSGLFTNLVNLSACFGLIAWFSIALSHYYFRYQYYNKQYPDDRNIWNRLSYKAPWFPFAPIMSMIIISAIIIGQSYDLIVNGFDLSKFISYYGAVIFCIITFIYYKLYRIFK